MPQNAFFLRTRDLLVSQKMTQRHFIFTLHPLSMVIFATATVLAFVLLHNSSFNFHYYTQREATPTQKLARKCAATSRDFFAERLQSAFTLANQLRWIAQYIQFSVFVFSHKHMKGLKVSNLVFDAQSTIAVKSGRRFKRMLFIRTKHNMHIFRVIPFIQLQNDT